MTVNSKAPDKSGNVIVGIPELEQLKGKVVQLENDDHAYSLLKIIAEALGMQVGAGGSWTGTAYVSLGAFATKDTIGPDDLTPELKAQLKGDPGEPPTIDSALDLTSANPVMNSAIAAELLNLRALVASQYYPEGNVKDASELTAGIKYNFADDGTERTATVKPFSNTGDPENDNSGLVGRVVIPPFVDADGNPYIFDDGTRYKVVGVGVGSGNPADEENFNSTNENTNLTTVIAPSTVTTIGLHAFRSCPALVSVSLPAVTAVVGHSFRDCFALASVSLPAATFIGGSSFRACSRMATAHLPAVTTVDGYAFINCSDLSSVSLPAATTIGDGAFQSCSSLSSVSLPAATTIGEYVFNSCSRLASVDFGDTPRSAVPTLPTNAFRSVPTSCKIIVPDAQYDALVAAPGWRDLVTAGYTFLRHSEWGYARKYEVENKADKPTTFTAGNLAEFDSNGNPVDSGVTKYDFEPISPFAKYYPEGNVKDASELTAEIKYNFADGTERTATVKPFCNTGYPENDNSRLEGRVVIPPFVDVDGNPYISDDGTMYKVVGVSDGTAVSLNSDLTTIIAPSTVTTIGDYAFVSCPALTSVSLPSATTIGESAFNYCTALATISLPAATTIGSGAFYSCYGLASVSLTTATAIGNNAFSSCTSLATISLPAATTIREGAFSGCSKLESVSLPAATTIGAGAFGGCSRLEYVSLPVATTIEHYSFNGCTVLSTVSLPAATTIRDGAFDSCSELVSVNFGGTPLPSVPTLGDNVFGSVPTSCKIIVPDAQYDAWVAAPGWSDLVTAGYTFLRHSEWEDSLK